MVMRVVSAVMALLFGYAIAVQFNDVDPARWIAMYGVACLLSLLGALDVAPKPLGYAAAALAVLCLVWAGLLAPQAAAEGFSIEYEVPREVFGLVIVAFWSGAMVAVARRR